MRMKLMIKNKIKRLASAPGTALDLTLNLNP